MFCGVLAATSSLPSPPRPTRRLPPWPALLHRKHHRPRTSKTPLRLPRCRWTLRDHQGPNNLPNRRRRCFNSSHRTPPRTTSPQRGSSGTPRSRRTSPRTYTVHLKTLRLGRATRRCTRRCRARTLMRTRLRTARRRPTPATRTQRCPPPRSHRRARQVRSQCDLQRCRRGCPRLCRSPA